MSHQMIDESMEADFEGMDAIVARLGHWPSFRDAEVLAFTVERGPHSRPESSVARFTVRVRDDRMRGAGKGADLTWEFRGIRELDVKDWSDDKRIEGIAVLPVVGGTPRLAVQIESASGFEATFRCERVGVFMVEDRVAQAA